MAGQVGAVVGGTLSLHALIEEHSEAVEYDLIVLGLRLRDLGSRRFNWRDLLVIVKQSPETSALFRAQHGEDSTWNLTNHILANMNDLLALLWWAKTADGAKGRRQPKPLPRPGVQDDSKKKIGSSVLPADQMLNWLGWDSTPQAN